MSNETEIDLAYITNKYPKAFQILGYDVLIDTDSSYKPKVISSFQMCINIILTLLLMKPGQYPSLPYLGIDMENYLHEYADDPSIPLKIKNQLNDQCNRLDVIGITIECYIDKTSDGRNALVVEISGSEKLTYGSGTNKVIIGISYDKLNKLYVKRVDI